MMKTFRSFALSAPRLPDPEAVKPLLYATGRGIVSAGLMFVLSRAAPVTLAPACALSPFAMALFAAALGAGLHPAPLLAGGVLAAIGSGVERFNLALPIGCAVILAGSLAWSAAAPLLRRKPASDMSGMALAGLGALVPGLIYAGGALWPSALATAAAVAALASEPFLMEALRAAKRRRRGAMSEARIGQVLLVLMASAGLCAICPPAALCLGAAAAVLLWPCGALAGLGLGGSALLMTGDGRFAAVSGLCGAAAQLCDSGSDAVRAACVTASALVAGLAVKLSYAELAGLCAGATLAPLLPRVFRSDALRWVQRPESGCEPERLAALLRGDTVRRLRAMSAAFGDLAEGYLTPAVMPDEQALIGQLRESLCEGCTDYEACWTGERNRGARLLCDLVTLAVDDDGDAGLFDSGVPVSLTQRCRRARAIPERIGDALEQFAHARRSELKRCGENRLISAQFLQAQKLIDALAAEQARPLRLRDKQAKRAAAALARADIGVADTLLLAGQRAELVVTLREARWTEPLARRAVAVLGGGYVPAGAWGRTMRFAKQPRLAADIGAVCAARSPDEPSGDSHLTAMLDGERLLVLICDGMGCGEAAGRESAQAARLLGRFLSAGADWSLAIETVNALLVNLSAEDMFSTVDMLILNLDTGMAECMKLAACPTYIVREGALERVEGGRLPLGILERVQPAASRVQLMPGDTLLMASDGVLDAADPEALEEMLRDPGEDMNALSEKILALAQSAPGGGDDMTAICVRVRESDADDVGGMQVG